MKHTRVYFFLLMFMACSFAALAQNNEQAAFQKFKQAREAYDSNDYAAAANLLIETRTLLGSTNVRIQPMLIKSLVEIEDWHRAKVEVGNYYALNPDKELVEYQEIAAIDRQVALKIKEDQDLYANVRSSKSVTQLEAYLSEFPYGAYRSEVSSLMANQQDENAWNTAVSEGYTSAYESYLSQYPEGAYANEARETITRWDQEAYNEAKKIDSQVSLTYYLSNYPNGRYRNEVQTLLKGRQEEDAFAATSSGNLQDFEAYLQTYPNGKYAVGIDQAIADYLFKKAEDAYARQQYTNATRDYAAYLERYPNAQQAPKAKQKLKRATAKSNEFSSSYTGFTYEPNNLIGITSGRLNKDGIGFYYHARVTPAFFSAKFEKPEMEYTEETEPADRKIAAGSLSIGLSYPVVYPLWVYAGGGVHYQERFSKVGDDNVFYQLVGEKPLAFYPEAGLKVRPIRSITLIAGGSYLRDQLMYKVGIGFAL